MVAQLAFEYTNNTYSDLLEEDESDVLVQEEVEADDESEQQINDADELIEESTYKTVKSNPMDDSKWNLPIYEGASITMRESTFALLNLVNTTSMPKVRLQSS
jgi:hypothetical protein